MNTESEPTPISAEETGSPNPDLVTPEEGAYAQEAWPPAPSTNAVDDLHFRTPGVDLSISNDVLTFRLLFIRGFMLRFGWFIAAMIPLLLIAPFFDAVSTGGMSIVAQLGPALAQRFVQMRPFMGIVLACDGFLWLIYETMLLRGEFRFNRARNRFWAGIWPHSTNGLRYVAVRSQVSKTKTWTRQCFYLGFDHAAAVTFDRFNPLHRLVSIYGEATRSEYYLGYITDRETANRLAAAIAKFLNIECLSED